MCRVVRLDWHSSSDVSSLECVSRELSVIIIVLVVDLQ